MVNLTQAKNRRGSIKQNSVSITPWEGKEIGKEIIPSIAKAGNEMVKQAFSSFFFPNGLLLNLETPIAVLLSDLKNALRKDDVVVQPTKPDL